MFLKILFWIFLIDVIAKAVYCTKDHPRVQRYNLGQDVVNMIFNIVLTVFIGFYVFGGWQM